MIGKYINANVVTGTSIESASASQLDGIITAATGDRVDAIGADQGVISSTVSRVDNTGALALEHDEIALASAVGEIHGSSGTRTDDIDDISATTAVQVNGSIRSTRR